MNTFGQHFRMHSFGESHGPALGVIVDGCPAGVRWQPDVLESALARRRPGQVGPDGNVIVTSRNEADVAEVLSGVFEEKTLGTPIAMMVRNSDQKSKDYSKSLVRAGHADDIWQNKYGHRDHRGGGRASGRETVSRVMAGAVAEMFLSELAPNLKVVGYSQAIGPHTVSEFDTKWDRPSIDSFAARFPGPASKDVSELLLKAKDEGESYGGCVGIRVMGMEPGLGSPVFSKLKSQLASAVMSIGATNGVEFGAGFEASQQKGTDFHAPSSSAYGGLRGGISTGEDLEFRVSFKPTSSIQDVAKKGRHDPCIVPRAVPVVEAMTLIVLADLFMAKKWDGIE